MPSHRKQFIFWIAAAVVALAALIGILLWEHGGSRPRRALYVVGSPERGAALFYGDKQCSMCHSVNGKGGRLGPDLSGKRPGTPALGWLTTVLWNHAPGMWRQMRRGNKPRLSAEEMADILAFLYQASHVEAAGDAEEGQRVFNEKACARCHPVRSVGGSAAPDLAKVAPAGDSSAWTRAMWNHARSMLDKITGAVGTWPQFKGDEMRDLIAYANGGAAVPQEAELHGSPERGWRAFQDKCIQCHSVRGRGGSTAPELGPEKDIPLNTAGFATLLWNHAPAMLQQVQAKEVAAPTLEGDEISDIRLFLASLRYFEPSGSKFLGERAFNERGCARCHGPRAEGTKYAPKLRSGSDAFTAVSLATSLWSHGPAMCDRAEQLGIPWPTLASTDVGDLVSFLNDPARKK